LSCAGVKEVPLGAVLVIYVSVGCTNFSEAAELGEIDMAVSVIINVINLAVFLNCIRNSF
jgi:hypothetical protein